MIDRLNDLFGEPPLLKGEDKAQYLRLRLAVAESIQPKTVHDLIEVNDETNKYWEELRLRRNETALIEAAYIEALAALVEPHISSMTLTPFRSPTEIARRYYSGDAKSRKEMAALVEQYGITAEHIQAKAVQINGPGLQLIDRMMANREASRRSLRRERERRFDVRDRVPADVSEKS